MCCYTNDSGLYGIKCIFMNFMQYHNYNTIKSKVEPIFHQNVNRLTLGSRIAHDTQCEHCALPILTC